jgi:hypothetical protein
MFLNYCEQVKTVSSQSGLPVKRLLLPHGGSSIDKTKSRKSIVAHYIPEGAYVQTVGYFFGIEEERKIMEFQATEADRLMRWNEKPIFMTND